MSEVIEEYAQKRYCLYCGKKNRQINSDFCYRCSHLPESVKSDRPKYCQMCGKPVDYASAFLNMHPGEKYCQCWSEQ